MAATIVVTPRDPKIIATFKAQAICPATGAIAGARGSCPGYVVDHGIPKCAGGADALWNLFYQPLARSYEKDKAERALCRILKAAGLTEGAATD